MPEVSVLIPAYNRGETIGKALSSVFSQTYRDFEILVLDDGSTDNTGQILRKFSGLKVISREHRGIAKTRNELIKAAKGIYVAWLDSDDWWHEKKLEKQIAYFNDNPGAEIVFSAVTPVLGSSELNSNRVRSMLNPGHIAYKTYMAASLSRKRVYDRTGMFDERLNYMEDIEWLVRAKSSGIDLSHFIEEPLYFRRIHKGMVSLKHSGFPGMASFKVMADAVRKGKQHDKNRKIPNN